MLLNDEEKALAVAEELERTKGNPDDMLDYSDIMAKAQLKKDARYLEKYVFYVDARGYIALKPNATKNYQAFIKEALLEEVK